MKGSKYSFLKLVQLPDFIDKINLRLKDIKAEVSIYDNWIPKSIYLDKEAELKNFLKYNFDAQKYKDIVKWWLHVDTTTPNWDLISTCTIDGKRGILLVEAKAHWDELTDESHGKSFDKKEASENSTRNHIKIGSAINDVNEQIIKQYPKISISRDSCYQLSNRIAHAWWLANQGIPVVLLYLGFLNVKEMDYGNKKLLVNEQDWRECFTNHAKLVGVDSILDKWVNCGKSCFKLICKSI